jgi:ATP-dependent DNA helicase RecQ
VFGIVEAVANGLLEIGCDWQIELPAGVGDKEAFKELLALVVSVDELWGTNVVPQNIFIEGPDEIRWRNAFGGIEAQKMSTTVIKVDWAPNWATLPSYESEVDVVIRGVPLPVHAGWDPEISSERRNIQRPEGDQIAEMDGLLGVVADHAFGIKQFRLGQSQAIRRVLEGEDSCVLLPTGYGKTLVFQVAALLRPGATLVVAPLKALIDDQERRFVEDGIDRVAAITSDRTNTDDMRAELHSAISRGNAMVVIVTPERLQIRLLW